MATEKRINKLKKAINNKQPDLSIVFDNIHDPHNVSAILRTCESVGVIDTYLMYDYNEFPVLGNKSSASSKKWVNTHEFNDSKALFKALKDKDYTIYSTFIDSSSISIYDIDFKKPSAIILGNEHQGVSEFSRKYADKNIFIPMFGLIESLNVSVAAAIILYEALRQRLDNRQYPNETLSDKWKDKLFKKWVQK